MSRMTEKMWEAQTLAKLRASTACTGMTLPYLKWHRTSLLKENCSSCCGPDGLIFAEEGEPVSFELRRDVTPTARSEYSVESMNWFNQSSYGLMYMYPQAKSVAVSRRAKSHHHISSGLAVNKSSVPFVFFFKFRKSNKDAMSVPALAKLCFLYL
jgi:hypothetical protein